MERAEQEHRLAVAANLARKAGLDVEATVVFQAANRLTALLQPADVVVRVARTVRRNRAVAEFEIAVASALDRAAGPVAGLDPRVAPVVHERDGCVVTFWTHHAVAPSGPAGVSAVSFAHTLERLHRSMLELELHAPSFTERVDEASAIVGDPSVSPCLSHRDRSLLSETLDRLGAVVAAAPDQQLLHGEPHEGNLLSAVDGPRFIDFETCCTGPVEFDLAHAPVAAAEHYPNADRSLVAVCRTLSAAMVAAWRSDRGDVFPNGAAMRRAKIAEVRATV